MHILKKLTLYLNRALLSSFLVLLPTAFLLTFIFCQPEPVKKLVRESGVYSLLGEAIVSTATTSFAANGQTYGLSQQAIKSAAQKAFPTSDVQQKGEKIISDTYAWLNGETTTFQPTFDTTKNQKIFTSTLADEASKSIANKPLCSDQQLLDLSVTTDQNSLLQAPCRPGNFDANYLQSLFGVQFDASTTPELQQNAAPGFVNLSTASPNSQTAQKPIYSEASQLVFGILKNSFFIVVGFILVALMVIVGLTRQLRPSLRIIAKPFLITGGLLLLYAGVLWWLLDQRVAANLINGTSGQALQAALQPFGMIYIYANFYFGLGFALIGVVLFIIYRKTKPAQLALANQPQPTISTPQEPTI